MLPEVKAEIISTAVQILIAVIASGVLNLVIMRLLYPRRGAAETDKISAEARHEDAQAYEARASGEAQLLAGASDFGEKLVGRVSTLEESDTAKSKTITMLLANDSEREARIEEQQSEIETLKAEIEALKARDVERLTMIDAQNTVIGNLRQRIDELNAYITRLFDWIRERGLEPPTLEELV